MGKIFPTGEPWANRFGTRKFRTEYAPVRVPGVRLCERYTGNDEQIKIITLRQYDV